MSLLPASEKSNENNDEMNSQSSNEQISNPISPLESLPNDYKTALEEFRKNWQHEIQNANKSDIKLDDNEVVNIKDIVDPINNVDLNEEKQQLLAESFFCKAVELEQRGKVYDALPFYRKAVQIMPDIEFKFYEQQKQKLSTNQDFNLLKINKNNEIQTEDANHVNVDEIIHCDLYEKFQLDLARDHGGKLLLNSRDPGIITTECHISELPPELLMYILRWVVSSQLDMRSLEQCAAVSKGFYLCARDEEIWHRACVNVWGVNLGTLNSPLPTQPGELITAELTQHPGYATWRQMYIERERVLFNGCYISKTTYLRMGENSFQDQFYRPIQLVEYYRYIRFLPDGTAYMMTNADEPMVGVHKLKNLQQIRSDILRGSYRLIGNTIKILLNKQQPVQRTTTYGRQRGRSGAQIMEDCNTTKYCIELRIMNTTKRSFGQLVWLKYLILQTRNKIETTSEFDLNASKYPPLWFSPVRSYHLIADAPLA